jgi:hypothetical protein
VENDGGTLRNEQNWIGGSNYNPCNAAFVPPPPEYGPGLIGAIGLSRYPISLPRLLTLDGNF